MKRMLRLQALTTTMFILGYAHPSVADENATLFAGVRDALVIVSAGHCVGSGFLVLMDGKRFLITNEHVLRGGQPFSASLLDGRKLAFTRLEIAEDRDLIRYELAETNVVALTLSPAPHNIGESISVFGNSGGVGVATSIPGKLQGVGPLLIEIDAPFVSGNSGSPIVDSKGGVIGVATFAVRDSNPNDWVKQGTRFTQIRRFGVRVDGTKWKPIDQSQYFVRAEALGDIETFCIDFYKLQTAREFYNPRTMLIDYQYEKEKKRYRRCMGLCKLLADAVDTCNSALQRAISARYHANKASERRTRQELINDQQRVAMDYMLTKSKLNEHVAAIDKACMGAKNLIQQNDWLVQRFKDDATFWLEVLNVITEREKTNLR